MTLCGKALLLKRYLSSLQPGFSFPVGLTRLDRKLAFLVCAFFLRL